MQPLGPPRVIDPARAVPSHENKPPVIEKARLQSLLSKLDPSARLDADVETNLQQFALHFVEEVTQGSCELAKHRGSDAVAAKDVAMFLQRFYDIRVPGSNLTLPPPIVQPLHSSHVERVEEVNRAIRKTK
ncbi:hypothetical protein RCL1_003485 [Eukaryota sp. TZLM3-RCL]